MLVTQAQCKRKTNGFAGCGRQGLKPKGPKAVRQNALWSRIATGTESPNNQATQLGNNGRQKDSLEREADKVAENIGNPNAARELSTTDESIQPFSNKSQTNRVSRSVSHPSFKALATSSQTLSPESQQYFNSQLHYDFSDVHIHNNSAAAESAEAMNARAYTTGNHIVFNQGEYQPQTDSGRKLLAHELTHVVQQDRGEAVGKIQKQDKPAKPQQPTLTGLPTDGIHLKVEPKSTADNFPGDLAINGDTVIINNSGGAGTYNNVKNGTWAWIEIPGKSSPDSKYPTLHGFIETQYIQTPKKEVKKETPESKEEKKKELKPYNDCKESPASEKYSVIGNGDSSEKYQNEIDRLEESKQSCPDWKDSTQGKIDALRTYKAERGNSTLADCDIQFVFNGISLKTGSVGTFPAVSGEKKTDSTGDFFDYSAKAQQKSGGPIPEGIYWLNPNELKTLWYRPGWSDPAWGSHAITIHPFETTPTYGRGGFFIHGGAVEGSVGCIDTTSHMSDVADAIEDFEDCKIKLTVKYNWARVPA